MLWKCALNDPTQQPTLGLSDPALYLCNIVYPINRGDSRRFHLAMPRTINGGAFLDFLTTMNKYLVDSESVNNTRSWGEGL